MHKERMKMEILLLLLNHESLTADLIASALTISNKTVRNYLNQLDAELQPNHLVLIRKPGYGYYLEGALSDKLNLQYNLEKKINTAYGASSSERIYYILYQLLRFHGVLRISSLERALYASRSSIYHDIKKANAFLHKYDLIIQKDAKHAYQIKGNEENKRMALYSLVITMRKDIVHFYMEDLKAFLTLCFQNNHLNKKIKTLLQTFERKKEVKLALEDFEFLRLMFIITIDQIKQGNTLAFSNALEPRVNTLSMVQKIEDTQAVLYRTFHINFPQKEVYFLSSLFLKLKSTNLDFIQSEEIHEHSVTIVQEFAPIIYNKYPILNKIDFEKGLIYHISNLLKRNSFDYDFHNPLTDKIYSEFQIPYELAGYLIPILMRYCHIRNPEDEIAYISLHIAAALEHSLQPLHTLFLYEHRFSELKYSSSLIEAHISEIAIVKKCRYQEFLLYGYEKPFSIIFTTFPYASRDFPVFQIPIIPDKNFINKLREAVRKLFINQSI